MTENSPTKETKNPDVARFKEGAKRGAFGGTILAMMLMVPLEMLLGIDEKLKSKRTIRHSWLRWLIILPIGSLIGAAIGGRLMRLAGEVTTQPEPTAHLDQPEKSPAADELPPDGQHVQRLNAVKSTPSRTR
jgi:hypothetical protein